VQCVKVIATADGGSRFGDIDVEQPEATYAQNVPSLFVSQPLPVQELMLVTVPNDVRNTEPYPARDVSSRSCSTASSRSRTAIVGRCPQAAACCSKTRPDADM
jgi:hypothetical protein